MNGLKILAAFAAGLGCGILATRSYFDKKYKDIADEEIESMKEVIDRKKGIERESEEMVKQYHREVEGYVSSVPPTDIREMVEKAVEKTASPTEDDAPVEISSDEWLSDGYYDKFSMTYYEGDDVLIMDDGGDEDGPFADIDDTIGIDIFEAFRSGKESEIFVRNPNTGIDYDVVKDPRSYNG